MAKPFLKWAGGKTQLINEIENSFPKNFKSEPFKYIEPFVGSGAILFWIIRNFPHVEKIVINDINEDLINAYQVVATSPNDLIQILQKFEQEFHKLEGNKEIKKKYYYSKRDLFNTRNSNPILQAALFIFLNRTCFNGLYRVNKKNQFNVPIGSYKKPTICDTENLLAANEALQRVIIMHGDYEQTLDEAESNTFFYLDPPYKPLSNTSSFNSYSKENFNDSEQIRLRDFCKKLEEEGYKWMLSNSDVKDKNPNDDFFDEIYSEFSINRVKARRSINANANKRGKLNELLITNYHE